MNLFEEIALQRSFFWGTLKVLVTIPIFLHVVWIIRRCFFDELSIAKVFIQNKLTKHFIISLVMLIFWIWFSSVEPMYRSTDVINSTPIKSQINAELKTVNPDSEESLQDKSKRLIDKSRKSNDIQKDNFLKLEEEK